MKLQSKGRQAPASWKPSPTRCLVRIDSVLAPSLVVPGISKDNLAVTLADFGMAPFTVMLPLKMLKEHVSTGDVRVYTAGSPPSSGEAPAMSDGPARASEDGNDLMREPVNGLAAGTLDVALGQIEEHDDQDGLEAGPQSDGDADWTEMSS